MTLRIEIDKAPFSVKVDGVVVHGVVARCGGDERLKLVAEIQRKGEEAGDADVFETTFETTVPRLVSLDVVLTRDGEDWPMPVHPGDERNDWAGYLPGIIVNGAFAVMIGGTVDAEEPDDDGEEGNVESAPTHAA